MSDAQSEALFEDDARSNELAHAFGNAIAAVRRRWWLVLAVFVGIVAVTMWRTTRKPRIYQAVSVVQLEQASSPTTVMDQQTPYDWRVDPIQSAQEIIKSRELAKRVADALGYRLVIARPAGLTRTALFGETLPRVDSTVARTELTLRLGDSRYELMQGGRGLASARYGEAVRAAGVSLTIPGRPPVDDGEVVLATIPLEAAAGAIQGSIVTKGRPQTNIIEIATTGTEPFLVKTVADTLAAAYRAFSSEERRRSAAARTDIIARSLEAQQLRLDSAQANLQHFKERQQLSSASAEQQGIADAIRQIENQRGEVLIERNVYERLIGGLNAADTTAAELRRLAGTPALEKNQYISRLYDSWMQLVTKREELVAKGYNSRHRDIRATDSLTARTKDDLRNASTLYLQGLQSRIASLDQRIAALRTEMGRYPSLEAQEQQLVADVSMVQNVYEGLLSDYQRSVISQAIDEPGVRVVDWAVRPTAPIAPNRRRILITAIIFGVLLGLGAAVAVEQLDDSVKSPDEMRDRFDLAVLGTIPEIRDGPAAREAAGGDRLVTHLDPRSPVAEAYRSLRTNLAFARAHQSVRTLVLTSPGPSDGKSTTVSNLAITFAQQGQRTLVIDADLRRAVLDKLFDVPRAPGLTDVLVGQRSLAEVVNATAIPNLSVVGSGPFPPNPSELLGSSAMREVLRQAAEQYDIVLLDSPPLLAVTDAAVLSTMVDGALLVVRMGSTPRTSVRRAISQLHTVHGRVVGAVLNDVDLTRGGYGNYGYYYYYYYGQDGHRNGSGGGVVDRVKQWTRAGLGAHRKS